LKEKSSPAWEKNSKGDKEEEKTIEVNEHWKPGRLDTDIDFVLEDLISDVS
jgi:hypothetical protein